MKINYTSDIHADLWVPFVKNQKKYEERIRLFAKETIPKTKDRYDLLIIAGDIANSNIVIKWVLEEYAAVYKKIFYVFGNHEYYLDSKSQSSKYKRNSKNRINELKSIVEKIENVEIMEHFEEKEWNGKKIVGDTNWYDRENQEILINTKEHRDWSNIKGIDLGSYRNKSLENFEKLKDVDLIVTHLPPYPTRAREDYYQIYCNEIDFARKNKWIFGHTHENIKEIKNETLFVSSAIGYKDEGEKDITHKSLEI